MANMKPSEAVVILKAMSQAYRDRVQDMIAAAVESGKNSAGTTNPQWYEQQKQEWQRISRGEY